MNRLLTLLTACAMTCVCASAASPRIIRLSDYGVKPNTGVNTTPLINEVIGELNLSSDDSVTLVLDGGRYDFFPDSTVTRRYFISNHDQENPKMTGIVFEGVRNVTFYANGSDFIFHGRMLPVSLVNSTNCTLSGFHIDFAHPHITQSTVLTNDTARGIITYRMEPWCDYHIKDSTLYVSGEGWSHIPGYGNAFEPDTRHMVYRTSDVRMGVRGVTEKDGVITAPWRNPRLVPGTKLIMRGGGRPTPGIFLDNDKDIVLSDIFVHYAEGMGLLAQMSENITLNNFNVCLRGESDPRYFTTQADATHFSGCKGAIVSRNGLYESMTDDAINVHGTYLRIVEKTAPDAVKGRYMHGQSYGFKWGEPGDTVQFIASKTMEICGEPLVIESITPLDAKEGEGVKEFLVTFTTEVPTEVDPTDGKFGVENLTRSPSVVFSGNTVRNNRARGALFSTPRTVVVEDNFFDHTSGSAILLCGDCNGWYETGACHDVTIRNNRFLNALTNPFQFTEAVISIYPEIPDLENQKKYFHSNIVIENNLFETFDIPLVYAKSVDGLTFIGNKLLRNNDYQPFHPAVPSVRLERVINEKIEQPKE